jgi:NAD(P)H-nitrite reductase large subunit
MPPIEGLSEASGVYGLRDLPDAKAIAEKGARAENIVILGAGLVGMDAAYGLLEIGKNSLVIEMSEHILPINLDENAAQAYRTKFSEAGTKFKLNTRLSKVSCDSQGAVKSVSLSSGEELPCDLLIVATSTKPDVQWLSASGIAAERGVITDEYLMTNVENIYAAGDVTGISGTWPDAMAQGETAGMNMCGLQQEYCGLVLPKCTMSFFGIPTLSVGRFMPQAGDVQQTRQSRDRYEKIVLRDGVPVGVILQGDISRSGYWQYLIKNKINTSGIEKPIWKISFADAYSIEANGEYKWAL